MKRIKWDLLLVWAVIFSLSFYMWYCVFKLIGL